MIDRRSFVASLDALIATPALAAPPRSAARPIAAARAQVGVTRSYDSAYLRLAFPGGDVARAKGVCTDVIVRAYRDAFGLDLQALVNADMKDATMTSKLVTCAKVGNSHEEFGSYTSYIALHRCGLQQ